MKSESLTLNRALLVVFGAVIVPLTAEMALRVADYGYPTPFLLPYEKDGRPVLVDNQFFGYRFFPRKATRTGQSIVVDRARDTRTFRVVVLGESAAMGDPLPDFGLPRILEVALAPRLPGRRVEVVNAAMTAINSHVVREIARELPRLRPDAVVVYMGNNEVIGPYGPGTLLRPLARSRTYIRGAVLLSRTRLGQVLAGLRRSFSRAEEPAGWGGMTMFLERELPRDDERLEDVYAGFAANLDAVLAAAGRSGAKVVLATVAVNRRACPPFGSQRGRALAPEEERAWDTAFTEGLLAERSGDPAAAAAAYARAAAIDDAHAELAYRLARCLDLAGRPADAASHYDAALDRDTLRFRADSRINDAVRKAARRTGTTLVDFDQEWREADDAAAFVDHVHFSFRGGVLAASRLADAIAGAAAPRPLEETERACRAALALTVRDELDLVETMRARMEQPPFGTQRESAVRLAALRARATALREAVAATGEAELREAYARALALRPDDRIVREHFGAALYEMGHREEAARELALALRAVPHRFEARGHLARCLAAMGESDEALRVLRGSDRKRGHFHEDLCARIGDELIQGGSYGAAVPFLAELVRLRPGRPDEVLQLAETEMQAGRLQDAAAHLRAVIGDRPDHARARSLLGLVQVELGEGPAGLRHLEAASVAQPANAEIQRNLASGLLRAGDTNRAEAVLRRALAQAGMDPEAALQLGQLLCARGAWAEAADWLSQAVEAMPGNASAHYQLAKACQATGRETVSVGHLKQALAYDGDNYFIMNDLAWILATSPDDGIRDGAYALQLAKRAEALSGGSDVVVIDSLAACYAETGAFDMAVETARRALVDAREPLAACIRHRLALYEQATPYRERADAPCP